MWRIWLVKRDNLVDYTLDSVPQMRTRTNVEIRTTHRSFVIVNE